MLSIPDGADLLDRRLHSLYPNNPNGPQSAQCRSRGSKLFFPSRHLWTETSPPAACSFEATGDSASMAVENDESNVNPFIQPAPLPDLGKLPQHFLDFIVPMDRHHRPERCKTDSTDRL